MDTDPNENATELRPDGGLIGLDRSDGDEDSEEIEEVWEDLDRRAEIVDAISQETRFKIIQNIIGHPSGAPSKQELDYMIPSKSSSTIMNHLEALMEKNIVEKRELSDDQRQRDLPHTFYALTETGREILDEYEVLEIDDTVKALYEATEKPENIEECERAPRP